MKRPYLANVLFAAILVTQAARAATPPVALPDGPLYGGGTNVHPNMLLNLSVTFPISGPAYHSNNGAYVRTTEYLGYFNTQKCYSYHGGNRNITDGYFEIASAADTNHECDGKSFSGNFMNWVSLSSVDILRYALTGGDRIEDKEDSTILQRAVLSSTDSNNANTPWYANPSYFPRRTITTSNSNSAVNKVTPFNASTINIVSCKNLILFSDSSSGTSCDTVVTQNGTVTTPSTSDKKYGEYLVRVKVCDDAEGPARSDLCLKYTSHYKPVGVIQRNADRMRFGVMSYLRDSSAARYGGVLRSPLKYVGPKKFDAPNFVQADNELREWDAKTGVFFANPDDASSRDSTTVKSGSINYINQFGRSGSYKALDPLSELYYEGLRYLQGLQATSDATASMTDPMKDGFPVVAPWVDPITASCQANYMVVVADANTNWDYYVPGNNRKNYTLNGISYSNGEKTRDVEPGIKGQTPALDVMKWTHAVGDMEVDASGAYGNPARNPVLANLDTLDTGYKNYATYYIAGLAYWANTNDIRVDAKRTRASTFVIDIDDGGDGTIAGKGRDIAPRNSQLYLAAKYGGFVDSNADANPFKTKSPTGIGDVVSNIEWDRDGDGVPDNYTFASQPSAMVQSFRRAFSRAAIFTGSIAGIAASGGRIGDAGQYIYQGGFDTARWSGSLKKIQVTWNSTTNAIVMATTPAWDAATILTGDGAVAGAPTPTQRKIYTSKTEPINGLRTIEFNWNSDKGLTSAQQVYFNTSPSTGLIDNFGNDRVNYLRGQHDKELSQPNGLFRNRDKVLGDIINSNAIYVGAPAGIAVGPGYQAFADKLEVKGRVPMVYVGANDGMLHGFNADTGAEVFAYIPNMLLPVLGKLTAPEYQHRPYMDGGIAVTDATVNGNWRTLLAAGLGGGAQGVFVIDVTNPTVFYDSTGLNSGSGVVLEFSDSDDNDIGNVIAPPVIAKFKTGTSAVGVPTYEYFLVVQSGVNNYVDDGNFDKVVTGAVFLLSVNKGASDSWKQGKNYYKFLLPVSDSNSKTAVAQPAFVRGADGAVRFMYVGDMQGQLWCLKFTGNSPWVDALAAVPKPIFAAKDANNNPQPITIQPEVAFAPGGGYLVAFGTGKYIENTDSSGTIISPSKTPTFPQQTLYVIYDDPATANYSVSGRGQLALRTPTVSSDRTGLTIAGADFSYGLGTNDKRGWYMDFPDSIAQGERSVSNGVLFDGQLYFNTLTMGMDACSSGGGRAYALDVVSGLASSGGVTGQLSVNGMTGSPLVLNIGDPVVDARNAIGLRQARKKSVVFAGGTSGIQPVGGSAQNQAITTGVPAGRFSWREILDWQELRIPVPATTN